MAHLPCLPLHSPAGTLYSGSMLVVDPGSASSPIVVRTMVQRVAAPSYSARSPRASCWKKGGVLGTELLLPVPRAPFNSQKDEGTLPAFKA